mgnify:CR=1 FL=1
MNMLIKTQKEIFLLKLVFWLLVGIFVVILSYFVVPVPVSMKQAFFPFAAISAIAFFLLGGVLIFLTLKLKVKGTLKKFLILTGASSAGFLTSVILHNFIYGLFIYWFGADFWDKIGLADEPFFFILAIFVCPVVFLVGVVGSVVLFIKKRKISRRVVIIGG